MQKRQHILFLRKNLFLFVAIFSCVAPSARGGDAPENSKKRITSMQDELRRLEAERRNAEAAWHNALMNQPNPAARSATSARGGNTEEDRKNRRNPMEDWLARVEEEGANWQNAERGNVETTLRTLPMHQINPAAILLLCQPGSFQKLDKAHIPEIIRYFKFLSVSQRKALLSLLMNGIHPSIVSNSYEDYESKTANSHQYNSRVLLLFHLMPLINAPVQPFSPPHITITQALIPYLLETCGRRDLISPSSSASSSSLSSSASPSLPATNPEEPAIPPATMHQMHQIQGLGYTQLNATKIQKNMQTPGTTAEQAALTWLEQHGGYTQAQAQMIHAHIMANPGTSIAQAATVLGLPAPRR